jgi:hypothetical protein
VSGVLALVVFAGLVAYPAVTTTRLVLVVAAIGVAAWLVLLIAVFGGWAFGIAWAMFAYGAEYALFLRLRGGSVDTRAMFVAGALVLVAELGFRAIAPAQGIPDDDVARRSLFSLAGSVLFTLVVAGVVLVASGSVRSGLAFEALGVVGATLTLAALVRIAARARPG